MVIPGVSEGLVLSTARVLRTEAGVLHHGPADRDSADGTATGFPHRIQDTANDPALPRSKNGALYFPVPRSPDPITGAATNAVTVPPTSARWYCRRCIFAATDIARGVWKAPAGFQATTKNTTGVVARGQMTDPRQGVLNPLGVERAPAISRTSAPRCSVRGPCVTATDEQWRYVPVRRMALFLEQTLYANLEWVVFEPNAEPLWTAITMSINAFMLGLFKQNAFQGTKPSEAFQVLCNSQTTTQADIDNGIVNIVVAFAPLKPAEFVIITIAQMAGQTQTT